MDIPVCIGMPRSASRMAWQIVRELAPPEPTWWAEGPGIMYEKDDPDLKPADVAPWPLYSHNYIPGSDPVVYTYRNPIECYISLVSRARQNFSMHGDREHDDSLNNILEHQVIMKKLKEDEKNNREILWIRYEDYFSQDILRLAAITELMKTSVTQTDIKKILKITSIENNFKISSNYPENIEHQFHNWRDEKSMIQADHITEKTMGKPGLHLKYNQNVLEKINSAEQESGYGILREFAKELGY
jgi:hypothetical protein